MYEIDLNARRGSFVVGTKLALPTDVMDLWDIMHRSVRTVWTANRTFRRTGCIRHLCLTAWVRSRHRLFISVHRQNSCPKVVRPHFVFSAGIHYRTGNGLSSPAAGSNDIPKPCSFSEILRPQVDEVGQHLPMDKLIPCR